jgi:hypothetical protein
VVGEARNTNKAIFEEAREEHAQDLSGLEATESAVKEDITAVDSKDSTIKGRSRTTRKKVAAKVKLDNGEQ